MKLPAISAVIMCCIMLAACGDEQIVNENTNTHEAEQEQSNPSQGGTMTLAMHKPETLNPIKNRDNTVDRVLRLVYEPLFVINEDMGVSPNLAESYSIEGNTVTIKLKPGVKWDDGNPVTADDVIYTLEEIEDAGLDTVYKNCSDNITSYSKEDDLTVKISYSEGLGCIGYSLCFPVIPEHYYDGNAAEDLKPVGNGSYKFQSYTLVKEMKLTASDTGLNGRPYITEIDVKIIPDTQTEIQALESGVIDAATIDINSLGAISTELGSSSIEFPSNQFEYLGFNVGNEMFSNVAVRQGLAHLIPREDIISNIYVNKMTESVTPINPDNSYTSRVGEDSYEYDTNLANALVSSSGKGFGSFNFTILVNSDNSARVESARLISEAFNSVGMHTSVEAVEYHEYIKRLQEGSFAVYMGGVKLKENMDVSSLVCSNGSMNYGGYADVNMDKLAGDAAGAMSEEGYKAALNELNKYISSQLPVVGIGFKSEILVTNDRIKGEKKPSVNNIYGNIYDWYIG